MQTTFHIALIEFDKSFYYPGEPVKITIGVESDTKHTVQARIIASVVHLADPVDELQQEIRLSKSTQVFEFIFTPPSNVPRGYGLDLRIESEDGRILTKASKAFDVLEHWTQSPRYGFLSDFSQGRSDATETIANLNRYHINALQFYDWMYRHEQFLTGDEPYRDPLGRMLSRVTVDDLIAAAHEYNMAAMPYTAVYGASVAFFEQHSDWALLKVSGEPIFFGENFLVIMDPRLGSPWTQHLLDQFAHVLQQTDFDGIHLDQYGDPKVGFDRQGNKFDLAEPLADFIDATREVVISHRPEGAVIFNAVNNWPIENVAPAGQNLVYIEVWPPHNWFTDLHNLIVQGQDLGGGKPVVLAAYIDPAHEYNILLMDSIIFASGGAHIELGENDGMLADPYFPDYKSMSPQLAKSIERLYNFSVRYQDLIGPGTKDATVEYTPRIEIVDLDRNIYVNTSINAVKNKVWPIVRYGANFTAISLVNLLGLDNPDWNKPVASPPRALGSASVRISEVERRVSRVWMATPDEADLSPRELDFSLENGVLAFDIPSLVYWDLIVVEWSN